MHITTITLIISILGLISSFFLVGIIPSLVSFVMGIRLIIEEKSIDIVRILAISFAGILLPIIMYLNTFGLHLPTRDESGRNFYQQIMINNYSNLAKMYLQLFFCCKTFGSLHLESRLDFSEGNENQRILK